MRVWAAILLLLCFAVLGSGALQYWHNLSHEQEDAALAEVNRKAGRPAQPTPIHTEYNCFLHAQLQLPMMQAGFVPLLVFLGLFVAFLALLRPALVPQRVLARIDCRGPPVR